MRKYLQLLLVLSLLLVLCNSSAYALSLTPITVTSLYPATDKSVDVNFGSIDELIFAPGFNPTQGILTSVDVSFTSNLLADFTLTNPINAGSTRGYAVMGGTQVLIINSKETLTNDLFIQTPTLIVNPLSHVHSNDRTDSVTNIFTFTSQSDLNFFTNVGDIVLNVQTVTADLLTSVTTIGTGTKLLADFAGYADESITITYNYDERPPVPEPGTIMLMGSGLMMLGGKAASRFRRKNKKVGLVA